MTRTTRIISMLFVFSGARARAGCLHHTMSRRVDEIQKTYLDLGSKFKPKELAHR